jgi:phenylalanyl-tRNA synthetase alpha chain
MAMREQLTALKHEALDKAEEAKSEQDIQAIRVAYLGKKGPITEVLRGMGKLSAEERPIIGALANEVRDEIKNKLDEKSKKLQEAAIKQQLEQESIDVTLPGRPGASRCDSPVDCGYHGNRRNLFRAWFFDWGRARNRNRLLQL